VKNLKDLKDVKAELLANPFAKPMTNKGLNLSWPANSLQQALKRT
jgi:hypothetical protein